MSTRRANFKERINVRRQEAEARQTEREKRGDSNQLKRLERDGFGHCREATKLREKLGKPVEV